MNPSTAETGRRSSVRRAIPSLMLAAGLAVGGLAFSVGPRAAHADVLASNPALSVGVLSVVPGGTLSISGSGFAAGEAVYLTLSSQTGAFASAQADGAGNLAANITIPSSVLPGIYTLTATGGTSLHSASATILVTSSAPVLTVSPTSIDAGGTVSVSGSGFVPNESVAIAIGGQSGTLATLTTNASGAIVASTVTLPAAETPAAYTLTATGSNSDVASTTVTVNALTVSLSTTNVVAGGTVTIAATGFAPNELVSVTINGLPGTLAILQADASGALSGMSISLPLSLANGSYTLTLTGLTSGNVADAPLIAGSTAATVPSANPSISVSAPTASVGGAVTVSGSGFAPNEQVSIALIGQASGITSSSGILTTVLVPSTDEILVVPATGVLATITADASGNLPATSVTIPTTVVPDFYALTATGASSGASTNVALIVN